MRGSRHAYLYQRPQGTLEDAGCRMPLPAAPECWRRPARLVLSTSWECVHIHAHLALLTTMCSQVAKREDLHQNPSKQELPYSSHYLKIHNVPESLESLELSGTFWTIQIGISNGLV